nr:RDD family protein [uncultured Roseateles sp.]
MSVSAEDRFAPPQAVVADVEGPDAGEVLAGRGIRFVAMIVDTVILIVAIQLLSLIPALGALIASSGARASFLTLNLESMILGLLVFFAIQAWPLVSRAQTLGKMLCKLRIVRSDGSKPDAVRLLVLRYGIGYLLNINLTLSFIYGVVDALLIFRESRQCLHDTIADTKVIKL